MKKILILSNCAASNFESNGRIHLLHYLDYLRNNCLFNFYLTGSPDVENINYLHFSNKDAFKTKIFHSKKSFLRTFFGLGSEAVDSGKRSKLRKPFFHWARNICYSKNKLFIEKLSSFIKENHIESIIVWGSNVPFLYEYAYKLSIDNQIELFTFTGEDYPLKKYNYLCKTPSLFFRSFQKSLFKNAKLAYAQAKKNVFASEDLLQEYTEKYKCLNASVVNFSSELEEEKSLTKPIKKIVYAGNLYCDRANAIIEIANHIRNKENISIDVYGNGDKKTIKKLCKCSNVNYCKTIPYSELISILKNADLLLHVEGFSDYYKKDCKFAFSTKISDYFMLNRPFFVYGPKEISGVKFALNINPDFVAVCSIELSKLDDILSGKKQYKIDYKKITETFSAKNNSKKMYNIIEY